MVITLTTDFGYQDPFVGIMKGVILGINPQARIIDLSHGIAPQDIAAAALMLRHAVSYFPAKTIHVAVVDPGVGSERHPLLIESLGCYLIGPDNGVLSLALHGRKPDYAVRLSNPNYHLKPTSATFHGRDIFSPVAAHLSLGIPPPAFGECVEEFIKLRLPVVRKSARSLEGEILYIDRFGNLFTNIEEGDLAGLARDDLTISFGTVTIRGLTAHYSAVRDGHYVALINSWGLLEIAAYQDSAQKRTGAKIGDKIQISVS
jgi:S-adenosylmethionine hydrolase